MGLLSSVYWVRSTQVLLSAFNIRPQLRLAFGNGRRDSGCITKLSFQRASYELRRNARLPPAWIPTSRKKWRAIHRGTPLFVSINYSTLCMLLFRVPPSSAHSRTYPYFRSHLSTVLMFPPPVAWSCVCHPSRPCITRCNGTYRMTMITGAEAQVAETSNLLFAQMAGGWVVRGHCCFGCINGSSIVALGLWNWGRKL